MEVNSHCSFCALPSTLKLLSEFLNFQPFEWFQATRYTAMLPSKEKSLQICQRFPLVLESVGNFLHYHIFDTTTTTFICASKLRASLKLLCWFVSTEKVELIMDFNTIAGYSLFGKLEDIQVDHQLTPVGLWEKSYWEQSCKLLALL